MDGQTDTAHAENEAAEMSQMPTGVGFGQGGMATISLPGELKVSSAHTFKLDPKHRIVSALLAASVAASQFRGCPNVPLSPKCTMVSRS